MFIKISDGYKILDALLYMDHLTSASLSTGNHLSVVSIDLEKAFDKIGIHAILHQLLEWKVGPKILNYVKSFMLNRKFRVKVNGFLSDARPLHNGIPQGSPLSVVLFQIAMEKLNKIIEENRFFSHCIYADDIYLIAKIKDPNVFCNEFDTLFEMCSIGMNIQVARYLKIKPKYCIFAIKSPAFLQMCL